MHLTAVFEKSLRAISASLKNFRAPIRKVPRSKKPVRISPRRLS